MESEGENGQDKKLTQKDSLPSRTDAWKLKVALLVLLVAFAGFSFKAVEKSLHSDFERYYTAGWVMLAGGDIYMADGHLQFKYLPFFSQFMTPFASFEQNTAAWLWYGFLCLCFLGMILFTLDITLGLRRAKTNWLLWGGIFALLFCGRYFVNNARAGQVNIPVAFFSYLSVWLLWRRKDPSAGLAAALAACLKFMPVVLIIYFAWKRRWQAFISGIMGIVLFGLVFPALAWGPTESIELLDRYVQSRSKMVTGVPKKDSAGESVPALVNRFLREVQANSYKERKERSYTVNFVNLPVKTVSRIALGGVVLLVLLFGWFTRKTKNILEKKEVGAELGLVFILMLLISPEARNAHFITLMLPAVAVFAAALRGVITPRKAAYFLVPSVVFTSLTSSGVVGEAASSYLSAYGAAAWGTLILAAACVFALKKVSLPETDS